MRRLIMLLGIAFVSFGMSVTPVRGAAGPFNFIRLDYPGATDTWALGINNARPIQVVGWYLTPDSSRYHGFLWAEGRYTTIDGPGAYWTQLYGINDLGHIVGSYSTHDGTGGNFVWAAGSFRMIDVPGVSGMEAYGINNADQVVGRYAGPGNPYFYGFSLFAGNVDTIDFPGNRTETYKRTEAYGINNRGQIVGKYWHTHPNLYWTRDAGFLVRVRRFGPIFTKIDVPGCPRAVSVINTTPYGINDIGQVVGSCSSDASGTHGFLLDGGTFFIIDFPGAVSTELRGINTPDPTDPAPRPYSIVGVYVEPSNAEFPPRVRGFLATPAMVNQ